MPNKLFPENWKLKYFLSLITLILIGLFGASTSINIEEQLEIKETIDSLLGETPNVNFIFFNNIRIALLIMLPVIGMIIAIMSIYVTGVAFSVIGNEVNISGSELYILTAMMPFFWLEFLSYAASFMYAFYISKSIIKRNMKIHEIIKPTILVIISIIILLYIGAIVEMYFIENYESL